MSHAANDPRHAASHDPKVERIPDAGTRRAHAPLFGVRDCDIVDRLNHVSDTQQRRGYTGRVNPGDDDTGLRAGCGGQSWRQCLDVDADVGRCFRRSLEQPFGGGQKHSRRHDCQACVGLHHDADELSLFGEQQRAG